MERIGLKASRFHQEVNRLKRKTFRWNMHLISSFTDSLLLSQQQPAIQSFKVKHRNKNSPFLLPSDRICETSPILTVHFVCDELRHSDVLVHRLRLCRSVCMSQTTICDGKRNYMHARSQLRWLTKATVQGCRNRSDRVIHSAMFHRNGLYIKHLWWNHGKPQVKAWKEWNQPSFHLNKQNHNRLGSVWKREAFKAYSLKKPGWSGGEIKLIVQRNQLDCTG